MNDLSSVSGQGLASLATPQSSTDPVPPDPKEVERLKEWADSSNIAMIGRGDAGDGDDKEPIAITDEQLSRLGQLVVREYEIDENSRSDWKDKMREAMDLAMQVAKQKQYPWPLASNILYPLMTTAAIQFNARAYPAIVMGNEVVKGVVIGPDDGVPASQQPPAPPQQPGQPPAPVPPIQWAVGPDGAVQAPGMKQARADRIGQHMSFQLLDDQTEWEPEMDTLLLVLPIVGCEFKKTYFDKAEKKNASLRVSAEHLVINYKAKSLERAPRITEEIEYYPLEIEQMERSGVFRKITYTASESQDGDDDAPVKFLEQHRWYDFDDDGVREPYIVTVAKQSSDVVRIVARYDIDSVKYNFSKGHIQSVEPIHYYTKYDFLPNPDGGIYGVGFGMLLKPINESINTTLNMLIDAGHLANVQGGFIGKGLSMNAGALRFQPGEWKPVNATGAVVKDSLVPLVFPGPSEVLFKLLGMLVEAAKEISGVKDVLTGETISGNTPATVMLAMIEQGLKTYTAIYKRVHRAFKAELAKLYRLNRLYLDQEASYKIGNTWKKVTRADYEKGSGVEPVSDPTIVTDMQKLGQAQYLEQYKDDPLMQGVEIRRRMLKAANISNIDALFNPNPPKNPAIVKAGLELQMQQDELQFKKAHDAASLQLRARHDVALIESEAAKALNYRAQALNQVAQAEKAVGSEKLGWAEHALGVVRMQIDALAQGQVDSTVANTDPFANPPADSGGGAPPQPAGAP